MSTETIFALFQTVSDAERAIGALRDHGVESGNIGVVARRPAEQDESAHVRESYVRLSGNQNAAMGEPEAVYVARADAPPPAIIEETITPTSSADTPVNVETVGKKGITTTTPADAGAGAAVGMGVGLLAGILASAVAMTVPGVGLVLGGGMLASAVSATVATTAAGALAGGVTGFLRDMGMSEHAAASIADRIREGDYLVSATIDTDRYDEVEQILMKYNAVGVDTADGAGKETFIRAWATRKRDEPEAIPAVAPAVVDSNADVPTAVATAAVAAAAVAPVAVAVNGSPVGSSVAAPVVVAPVAVDVDSSVSDHTVVAMDIDKTPLTPLTPMTGHLVTETPSGVPLVPAQVVDVPPVLPAAELAGAPVYFPPQAAASPLINPTPLEDDDLDLEHDWEAESDIARAYNHR